MLWLSEELKESHPLFNSVQYVTQQSCERQETEMNYKDINRKFISFDLRDKAMMLLVGMTVKPFGFFENMHDYLIDSSIRFFRVWAEKAIAKRGEIHLRKLYMKHPEKFFNVEFENKKSTSTKLAKGCYIINEICNVKRVSLHEKEQFPSMINDFRRTMEKESQQAHQDNLIGSSYSEGENEAKLIPIANRSAAQ
ncbi:MAG: hypothetical protein K2Y01_03535 [Rhabdochlamydiaceae bacterium]|nr:hypothetical protein [Rhabdochlamydiaceae bacterium]